MWTLWTCGLSLRNFCEYSRWYGSKVLARKLVVHILMCALYKPASAANSRTSAGPKDQPNYELLKKPQVRKQLATCNSQLATLKSTSFTKYSLYFFQLFCQFKIFFIKLPVNFSFIFVRIINFIVSFAHFLHSIIDT